MDCLAFGPDESYMAIPTSDQFISSWRGELADWWCEGQSSVAYAAYSGSDGYYVRYKDGTSSWKLHPELGKLIKREGVKWIVFGSEGYVFKSNSGGVHWWNLPDELEERLESSSDELASIGLGRNNSYVAIFSGDYIWGGLPESLNQILETWAVPGGSKVETLDGVWLSAYDDRFYLQYNGGAAYWSGCPSYFSTMMQCDKMLNPLDIFYTNESISAKFADGRSIYDAARDLNSGALQITDFPMIEVFEHKGSHFSKNNRRLWAFRNSGVFYAPVNLVAKPADAGDLTIRREVYVRFKKKS